MEKLFETRTKSTEREYTQKIYRDFFRFHTWSRMKWAYLFLVVLGALLLTVVVFLLAMGSNDYPLIGCSVFLAAFLLIYPWFAYLLPYRMWKSSYKYWGVSTVFSFFSDNMEVKNEQQQAKIYYSQLYRVYETAGYFYFYLNKMAALIVSKDSFIQGTPEELHIFLQQKLDGQYKIIKIG